MFDRGWYEVPTSGDYLTFEAEVADNYTVRLGVSVHTDDGLCIWVSDEVGFEYRCALGQVRAGLQNGVLDIGLIKNVANTCEALCQEVWPRSSHR